MLGLVLAAGAGRRLRPDTDDLPKTLLPVDGETTILDVALANLAAVGLPDVVVVVGYAAAAIEARVERLEARHGVRLTLVHNDKAEIWNNAYSLWVAREALADGALVVNGDTLHPASVERTLLASRGEAGLLLAVDAHKSLGDEEMKVVVDADGAITCITKLTDPAGAYGEYIGASLVEAHAASALVDALEATWRHDPDDYYEDGYQRLVDSGAVHVGIAELAPGTSWVEVDTHADLATARRIACHS